MCISQQIAFGSTNNTQYDKLTVTNKHTKSQITDTDRTTCHVKMGFSVDIIAILCNDITYQLQHKPCLFLQPIEPLSTIFPSVNRPEYALKTHGEIFDDRLDKSGEEHWPQYKPFVYFSLVSNCHLLYYTYPCVHIYRQLAKSAKL